MKALGCGSIRGFLSFQAQEVDEPAICQLPTSGQAGHRGFLRTYAICAKLGPVHAQGLRHVAKLHIEKSPVPRFEVEEAGRWLVHRLLGDWKRLGVRK